MLEGFTSITVKRRWELRVGALVLIALSIQLLPIITQYNPSQFTPMVMFALLARRGVAQRLAEEYRAGLGKGSGPPHGSVGAQPGSPSRATPAGTSRPEWAGIPSRRAAQDDRAEKRRCVRSGAMRLGNTTSVNRGAPPCRL